MPNNSYHHDYSQEGDGQKRKNPCFKAIINYEFRLATAHEMKNLFPRFPIVRWFIWICSRWGTQKHLFHRYNALFWNITVPNFYPLPQIEIMTIKPAHTYWSPYKANVTPSELPSICPGKTFEAISVLNKCKLFSNARSQSQHIWSS